MLAARLNETGTPLVVEDVPEPAVPPGGARVRVLASHVLAMTEGVVSGGMPFDLPTPYTLGTSAIGVVDAVGEGVYWLREGQTVFCDPYVYSEANDSPFDPTLLGWFGLSEASKEIQRRWRDGAFAEKAVYPAENLTVIDAVARGRRPENLAILNFLNVAYGAALRGELRPGQRVAVTGATGNLGASAVAVALAMGAARVAAVGRTERVLEEVRGLDPARVVPVRYGDPDEIGGLLRDALGEADLVLDALGAVGTPDATMGAISALRPRGTAVLFGGVYAELPIDYPTMLGLELTVRGSFMAPRTGPRDLARMIEGGTLALDAFRPHGFGLEGASEAIYEAQNLKGLDFAVLVPQGAPEGSGR